LGGVIFRGKEWGRRETARASLSFLKEKEVIENESNSCADR
jgi:hypothetical protein